jgi:hypothetical protein
VKIKQKILLKKYFLPCRVAQANDKAGHHPALYRHSDSSLYMVTVVISSPEFLNKGA